MDKSAVEALIIALNTFIFVIALSVGMALMKNVNQMVELTKQVTEASGGGNLSEAYGSITERILTGSQVMALYYQRNDIPYTISFPPSISYGPNQEYILECTGENSYTIFSK